MVTQQGQNNSVLARDPNFEREMIQESSGITSLSDQGHGTRRELPWPHESTRFLTWSCALSVLRNQILCHFTSESLLRNKIPAPPPPPHSFLCHETQAKCLETMAWAVFLWSGRKVINAVRKDLEIASMILKMVRPDPWK